MEETIIKELSKQNGWVLITIFCIYLAYKIILTILSNRKAKKSKEILDSQFATITENIEDIAKIAKEAEVKDRIIDSIDYKLKVIYNQWESKLSKECAIIIIQNIYFNFATVISNEIYDLQKRNLSRNKLINQVMNTVSITNDDKLQELELFMYRDRYLNTFTNGEIIDPEQIKKVINEYSDKNGLLRTELENLLYIEAQKIIKLL